MGGGLSRLLPLWRTVSPSEPHTAHIKRCCEDVRRSLHGLCFTILIHPHGFIFPRKPQTNMVQTLVPNTELGENTRHTAILQGNENIFRANGAI